MTAEQGASLPELEDTDRARADLYALLARLYYGGPDGALLRMIAQTGEEIGSGGDTPLGLAWRALAVAAESTDPVAAQQEYDDLFIGTGRAEISPYATYYLAQTGREKILVRLRADLEAMGLSRKETSREPEDHFAGLFDVMRHLVQRGSIDAALQEQRVFFDRFIKPSYESFCGAVEKSGRAEIYGRVAALTLVFLGIEKDALEVT
jgi:TorA maturation chaperone TorD